MTIYCAKCEAANSEKAPFCGECGHTLTALAPAVQTDDSPKSQPDDHTENVKRADTPPQRTWGGSVQEWRGVLGYLVHLVVVAWAVGLCVVGCVPLLSGGEEPFLAPYLPAGLMVLLFYAFRDYYYRWEKLARQQRKE